MEERLTKWQMSSKIEAIIYVLVKPQLWKLIFSQDLLHGLQFDAASRWKPENADIVEDVIFHMAPRQKGEDIFAPSRMDRDFLN